MNIKERIKAHRFERDSDGRPITKLDHFCAPSNQFRPAIESAKTGFKVLMFLVFTAVIPIALAAWLAFYHWLFP